MTDESAILDTARTATVEIRGEAKSIQYDLSEMTPRLRKMLTREGGDADEAAIEFVATVVTEWDLTDRQGQAIPLTAEGISGLSYKALNTVMGALNGGPNETGANDQTGASPA